MTYSPGTFDAPRTASAGDVLGTIAWEDLSITDREDATALRIRGVVEGVQTDGNAIKGSMRFGIGSVEVGGAISEGFMLTEGVVHVTNSAYIQIDNGPLIIGNMRTGQNHDRRISFYNNASGKRWSVGVDSDQSKFAIHQGTAFTANNHFEIDGSGNVLLQGTMTATKGVFSSGIPTFTGSVLTIDGGTF